MAEFSFYDFCQQENGTIEGYNEVAIDEEVNEMWHDYFRDNAKRINEWNESDSLDRFTAANIDTIYEVINRNYEPVQWLVDYTARTAKELGTPAHAGNFGCSLMRLKQRALKWRLKYLLSLRRL